MSLPKQKGMGSEARWTSLRLTSGENLGKSLNLSFFINKMRW